MFGVSKLFLRPFLAFVVRELLAELVQMVDDDGYIRVKPELLAVDILTAGGCMDEMSLHWVFGSKLPSLLAAEVLA